MVFSAWDRLAGKGGAGPVPGAVPGATLQGVVGEINWIPLPLGVELGDPAIQ